MTARTGLSPVLGGAAINHPNVVVHCCCFNGVNLFSGLKHLNMSCNSPDDPRVIVKQIGPTAKRWPHGEVVVVHLQQMLSLCFARLGHIGGLLGQGAAGRGSV